MARCTAVTSDSAADAAKIRLGDVILRVRTNDMHTVAELEARLMALRDQGQRNALILVKGEAGKRWLTLLLQL
jgi:S1-C subfamily serine protease